MNTGREPDPKRALRPVPGYERAVREVSRMFADAGIRHALVGALGANADRELLRTAVQKAAPSCADTLERAFGNVDRLR